VVFGLSSRISHDSKPQEKFEITEARAVTQSAPQSSGQSITEEARIADCGDWKMTQHKALIAVSAN